MEDQVYRGMLIWYYHNDGSLDPVKLIGMIIRFDEMFPNIARVIFWDNDGNQLTADADRFLDTSFYGWTPRLLQSE
jgi:hypothetical protein